VELRVTALTESRANGILALRLITGEVYGADAIVDEQPIVKRIPALRFVLG
jgi:hypothetical protein